MSGNVPRVTGGTVLGAVTASQLPNTGPADVAIQIAAFVGIVLATWFVVDLITTRRHRA
jgi:ABC-type Fe3+-siderophore transport system permease subunit